MTNKPVDVAIVEKDTRYATAVVMHRVELSHQGVFACELAKLILACGAQVPLPIEEGETFQRGRSMTNEEVVNRATAIAALMYERLEAEGHTVTLPAFGELLREDGLNMGFRSGPRPGEAGE